MQIFKTLWRFLWPKASDLPVVSTCLFLLAAILVHEWLEVKDGSAFRRIRFEFAATFIFLSPLTMFAMAFGATLGSLNRSQLRANYLWAFSILAVYLGIGAFLYWVGKLQLDIRQPSIGFNSLAMAWILQIIVWLVSWLGTRLCFIWRSMPQQSAIPTSGMRQYSRTKILIYLMLGLYVIYLLSNLLPKLNATFDTKTASNSDWFTILGVVAGLGLIAATSAIIADHFKTTIAFLFLVLFYAMIAAIVAGLYKAEASLLIVGLSVITIPMLLVGKRFRQLPAYAWKPLIGSIWSLGLAMTMFTILIATILFDLSTLIGTRLTDLQAARVVRQLSTLRGVEASLNSYWETGAPSLDGTLTIHPSANPNCFALLDKFVLPTTIHFDGLNATIDCKYLKNLVKSSWMLLDSEVTLAQLENLAAGTSYFSIRRSRIVDHVPITSETDLFASCSGVDCIELETGEAAKLLASIDGNIFKGSVALSYCRIFSPNDWQQILIQSRYFGVSVDQIPPPEVLEVIATENVTRSLEINVNGLDLSDRDLFRLADSSLTIDLQTAAEKVHLLWDILFVSRNPNLLRWGKIPILNRIDKSTFLSFVKSAHLLFEVEGSPRGLWIPTEGIGLIPRIAELTELEILSFDSDWLPSLPTPTYSVPQISDLTDLGQLIKLKRLEFSDAVCPADLSFLRTMPDLEYLRLDVSFTGVREVDCGFEAKFCPQLKTLVIAGRPTKALALEIAKLAALESLTVVESEGVNSFTAEQREEFQTLLGSRIRPIYVLGSAYEPNPPPEFKAHRQRVIEQLRDKYLTD